MCKNGSKLKFSYTQLNKSKSKNDPIEIELIKNKRNQKQEHPQIKLRNDSKFKAWKTQKNGRNRSKKEENRSENRNRPSEREMPRVMEGKERRENAQRQGERKRERAQREREKHSLKRPNGIQYKKNEMQCEPLDFYFKSKKKGTLSMVFGTFLVISIYYVSYSFPLILALSFFKILCEFKIGKVLILMYFS